MRVRTTAKIKIETRPEITKTIRVYSRALQHCVDIAWSKGIRNNVKLQPHVYAHIRKMGLQSQLAMACIKQACGTVKKAGTKPIIKQCSIRYNFPRSASIKGDTLSIATLNGRIKIPFSTPDCYRKYFSWDVDESLLRIDKRGRCFFLFCFSKEVQPRGSDTQNLTLGIDLGIKHLAVCSDGTYHRGGQAKRIKRKHQYLRGVLQSKGTRSAKRRLRQLSGRERRFMAWTNHNISKSIISSEPSKIVMEDLKGVRNRERGRIGNRWIHNWSYYQLRLFIQYKAERKGIPFELVNPYLTSQLCSRCGNRGKRKGSSFTCSGCGLMLEADLNASRNLASPLLGWRQATVNLPYVSCRDSLFDHFFPRLTLEHRCEISERQSPRIHPWDTA